MIGRIILVTLSSICAVTSLSYATDVSGDVWGEWTSAGNPYNVIGDLRVPPGSTLVIGPGCYVEFQGRYQFLVDNSAILQANGTESDSIIFTGGNFQNQWAGLKFQYADSGSQIEYSRIEHSHGAGTDEDGAVYCEHSYLELRNSLLQQNTAGYGAVANLYYNHMFIFENNLARANQGNRGIRAFRSNGIEIIGNIFTQNDQMSIIDIFSFYSEDTIAENIFFDNDESVMVAIGASDMIIERNIIYNNLGWIFISWQGSGGNIIRGNIIYNNHSYGPYAGGVFTSEDSEYLVENNTICNNIGTNGSYLGWIEEEHGINGPVIFKNNIIWGNSYSGDSLFHIGQNIIFSLTYSDVQGGWGGTNISVDPLFVDSGNGDFHLLPGSPCIDAGDPASPYDPDSTIADMGALYFDQSTGIKLPPLLPREITLHQNYPNPFNAGTVIKFELSNESRVSIDIYDILGRRVSSIIDGYYQPGQYEVTWDGVTRNGKELPSGIYLYKLKSDSFEQTRRMILLK